MVIDLLIRGHFTLFEIFMLFISVRFINYKLMILYTVEYDIGTRSNVDA